MLYKSVVSPERVRELLRDPGILFGLKLAGAGLLVTYLALVLRLDEPTWALFTVFVLMVTPYVGTIMEKSVLRICGTIIGAVLGYLLLGWQQQPLVMLPVVAVILAFCVAMFGQGLWSYGFFLCGLTIIDVMQAGLAEPQMSWRFALMRAEEVVLGIIVAVVVQSVLWPRYARVEFDKLLKETFTDLNFLLVSCVDQLSAEEEADILERARKLPARVAKMRTLINFGANESSDFRRSVSVFEEIVAQVDLMSLSIASLYKPFATDSRAWPELQEKMVAFGRLLGEELQTLEKGAGSDAREDAILRIRTARKELDVCLEQAKEHGSFDAETPACLLSLGHHYQALLELADAISTIHECWGTIATGQPEKVSSPVIQSTNLPSRFWVHLGIKGGIVVVVALLLENWLSPPGGNLLAISAWILLVRGPTAPSGRGDWRAFHGAILSILAWLLLGIILLWVHPFLASYAVMNVVLFSLLFLWGYIFYGRNPMTTPMLVGMLMIVGVFGLNAQEPVSFQSIADLVVGMALAILLSALIRRTVWPSLPQREILSRLRELLRISRKALERDLSGISAGERVRLAIIPGEVSARLGLLGSPIVVDRDAEIIGEYLQGMHRGAMILSASAGQRAKWSESLRKDPAYEKAISLGDVFRDHLLANETLISNSMPPGSAMGGFEKTFTAEKTAMVDLCCAAFTRLSTSQWLELLAFCKRMEEAGEAFILAARASSELNWRVLNEDTSL